MCFDIKVVNSVPFHVKILPDNTKQIKSALKSFLYADSFYSLDEYFSPLTF
jgi:hypothetical protein